MPNGGFVEKVLLVGIFSLAHIIKFSRLCSFSTENLMSCHLNSLLSNMRPTTHFSLLGLTLMTRMPVLLRSPIVHVTSISLSYKSVLRRLLSPSILRTAAVC